MNRIIKGDEVFVISGKSKGQRGIVLEFSKKARRVLVEGVNMGIKHEKPNPNLGIDGGRVKKEMALDVSNIALFNPATNKPSRVGFKTLDDGRKVRFFKSDGEVIPTKTPEKKG